MLLHALSAALQLNESRGLSGTRRRVFRCHASSDVHLASYIHARSRPSRMEWHWAAGATARPPARRCGLRRGRGRERGRGRGSRWLSKRLQVALSQPAVVALSRRGWGERLVAVVVVNLEAHGRAQLPPLYRGAHGAPAAGRRSADDQMLVRRIILVADRIGCHQARGGN